MRLGRMKRKPFIMETNVGLFDADRPSPCFCATNFSKKHPPYVMVDNRGSPSCCGYVAAPKCFRGAWTEQQERWINDTRSISADNIVGRDAADNYRCLGCNSLTEITFYDQHHLPTVMPLSPLVLGLKNMIKKSKKICMEWEKMDWGSPLNLLRVTFDAGASPEPTAEETNFTLFYYTSKSEGKKENVKNMQSWLKLINACLTKKNLNDACRWNDDCFCGEPLSNGHPPSNLSSCWAHRVARECFCKWWCAEFSNDYRGPPPPIIVELIQKYLFFRSKSEIEYKLLNCFFFKKRNGPDAVVPELPAESLNFSMFKKDLEFWIKKLDKNLKKEIKVQKRIDMTTVSEPGDVTPSVKRICIFKLEDGTAVSFEKNHDEFICQYADCSTENDPTSNESILKNRILGKIRSGRKREYHDYVFADCLYPAEKRNIIKVCRGATRVQGQ